MDEEGKTFVIYSPLGGLFRAIGWRWMSLIVVISLLDWLLKPAAAPIDPSIYDDNHVTITGEFCEGTVLGQGYEPSELDRYQKELICKNHIDQPVNWED